MTALTREHIPELPVRPRATILFGLTVVLLTLGGFTLWALVAIVLINRRDGAWQKPPAAPFKKDVIAVAGGVVVYAVVLFSHRWIAGIPLINPAG